MKSPNNFFYRILDKICRKVHAKTKTDPVAFEMKSIICKTPPTNQTTADIFNGDWLSAFPNEFGVEAGTVNHFDFQVDPRVKWTHDITHEGLKNARILELGPFEAYNTRQMEQLGAQKVIAVENNKVNFLKCLVVKEIMGLNASFLLGDFLAYLETCGKQNEHFDYVWASGVLYHQTEPMKLLELITKVTDKVFIHTHYYDEKIITTNPDVKDYFHPSRNRDQECGGYKATLHYRSYEKERYTGAIYGGGPAPYSLWMKKWDILGFLENKGFKKITIEVDDKDHVHGPGICFLAERI